MAPDGAKVLQEAARVLRPNGRIVVFDKFVADRTQPSPGRRVLNLLTNALLSEVTRSLGPMLVGAGLDVVHRERAVGGLFEIVLLRRLVATT